MLQPEKIYTYMYIHIYICSYIPIYSNIFIYIYISEVGGSEPNREIVSFRSSHRWVTCLVSILRSCSCCSSVSSR